jgi:hypothetical protein
MNHCKIIPYQTIRHKLPGLLKKMSEIFSYLSGSRMLGSSNFDIDFVGRSENLGPIFEK